MATRKGGGTNEPRGARGGQTARPGRETLDAPDAPEEVPSSVGRARDMVMVDPWGALLEGLLEGPEGDVGTGEKIPGRKRGETGKR